jgi:hypothetical protein
VVCWGRNDFGQSTAPSGLTSVAKVSAGNLHSCAIKTDEAVVCWGRNIEGQATPPGGIIPTAVQSINFTSTPTTPALVGGMYTAAATGGASGNPVTFSGLTPAVCTVAGTSVAFVGVGTCRIAADQVGGGIYLPAQQAVQAFGVSQRDETPPLATPTVLGTLGANGWFTSDVGISWSVVDNESAITSSTGCGNTTVTTNGDNQTYTCTAISSGGTATRSVTIKRDATVPIVTGTPAGTQGAGGWYTSDVGVAWSISPAGPSGVSPACAAATQTTDTESETFSCTATTGAGVSRTGTVNVKRDASPPLLTATVSGNLGSDNWYVGNVTVIWSASDNISSVASTPCVENSLSMDNPGTTYTCTATNGAGLSTTSSLAVKRDATPPAIGYTGNAGTYTVDQTVTISCSASDALSGIATNTCANIAGNAYDLSLGTTSYSANATDRAGNGASATTSFTVQVTSAGLCKLVQRFVTNDGVANSLCVKLDHHDWESFRNELLAQTGKKVSNANATILLRLATALARQ